KHSHVLMSVPRMSEVPRHIPLRCESLIGWCERTPVSLPDPTWTPRSREHRDRSDSRQRTPPDRDTCSLRNPTHRHLPREPQPETPCGKIGERQTSEIPPASSSSNRSPTDYLRIGMLLR